MTEIVAFNRTLDQELLSLMRGASLECLVCGEFVLHAGGMVTCPECNSSLRAGAASEQTRLQFDSQAG